ncbi:MAG TPA: efflux RND transporter periplasmic adaptor subunit [Burkholderiales bacterium]|nr:efflux RND transporter periplasmic adaptor subunit [Burkholderiales bacterium]
MSQSLTPKTRRRLYVAGTAVAASLAVAAVIGSRASAEPPPTQEPPAMPVSVATVVQSDVATWNEFSGRLDAIDRVDVRSRVAGTVQSTHFREGALVKKGDLLFAIDPAPYAAEVERASAQVAAAQARVAYTRSEAERAQRLLDEQAIAQREHDERDNARREADANLRAAQAALQVAQLNLGYTQVRAPVAGRVGRIEITVGNLVAAGPGAPVLTTLVSVSPIYASFDADEQVVTSALRAVRDADGSASASGQVDRIPVQMGTAENTDTPLNGRLQLVDNQVDTRSGTVRVRAIFDNTDGTLIPGQFVKLRMGQIKMAPALLINERAVGTDQNKKFVMVVGADNKTVYREVALGAQSDGLRIVTAGLKAQERIVINGVQRVHAGTLVSPQPVSMSLKSELKTEAKPEAKTTDAKPETLKTQAKADTKSATASRS